MATVNKAGQDWLLIKRWAIDKRAEHLAALMMSKADDDIHRGAIRILTELEAWVEPDQLPETTDPDYA